ncbi:MAG TPA: HD domain-containing phosphohydrolase [Conexibacter sp.]|nr:HD domain-containing phosphohydrolase [Conexibacter sp.]
MTHIGLFARRLVFAATAIALGADALHALTRFGGPGMERFFTNDLYLAIELLGVALCVARALRGPDQRAAWWCVAAGLAVWTAADALWIVTPSTADSWLTDALYLLYFPLFCAGLALLAAQGSERVAARMWVDGLLAALTVSALVVALLFSPIVDASHGESVRQIAVNLAYPVGDLVVVGFVLAAFATQAWRPGRAWALLGAGAIVSAVADTLFVYQDAVGSYSAGGLLDVLWPAAFLCCGWAAWQPWRPLRQRDRYGSQTVALPGIFASLALGLLAWDHFLPISNAAALLATIALGVAIVRAGIALGENARLLRRTRHEALTDGLTGLPNRRRLMLDLDAACTREANGRPPRPATFAFFDLDGFKGYNDAFGHAAGDLLLQRLATRLASVAEGRGHAYRLGGDEFCVLLHGVEPDSPLLDACRQALTEQGEGFRVGASGGAVAIPAETDDAAQALQLADRRMYLAKEGARPSSRRQTRDVLLQALREREPELHNHLHGVAALAVAVCRRLSLSAEQLDEVARAAELHDVGKLAIPDEILHKPGPLDATEWALMRQHTIIGDRILGAAPAMRPVAAIVRASHERIDGEGYPDGLAGEEIPLGARIVAVCDAYHAMTGTRAYQRTRSCDEALAELRRCAGTQFDAVVVEAFCELALDPEAASAAPAERPHAHEHG